MRHRVLRVAAVFLAALTLVFMALVITVKSSWFEQRISRTASEATGLAMSVEIESIFFPEVHVSLSDYGVKLWGISIEGLRRQEGRWQWNAKMKRASYLDWSAELRKFHLNGEGKNLKNAQLDARVDLQSVPLLEMQLEADLTQLHAGRVEFVGFRAGNKAMQPESNSTQKKAGVFELSSSDPVELSFGVSGLNTQSTVALKTGRFDVQSLCSGNWGDSTFAFKKTESRPEIHAQWRLVVLNCESVSPNEQEQASDRGSSSTPIQLSNIAFDWSHDLLKINAESDRAGPLTQKAALTLQSQVDLEALSLDQIQSAQLKNASLQMNLKEVGVSLSMAAPTMSTQQGDLRWTAQTNERGARWIARMASACVSGLDQTQLRLQSKGRWRWNKDELDSPVEHRIESDWTLKAPSWMIDNEAVLSGLDAELRFKTRSKKLSQILSTRSLSGLAFDVDGKVSADSLGKDSTLIALESALTGNQTQIELRKFEAYGLGGKIFFSDFFIDPMAPSFRANMHLQGLSLDRVLKLGGAEAVRVDGGKIFASAGLAADLKSYRVHDGTFRVDDLKVLRVPDERLSQMPTRVETLQQFEPFMRDQLLLAAKGLNHLMVTHPLQGRFEVSHDQGMKLDFDLGGYNPDVAPTKNGRGAPFRYSNSSVKMGPENMKLAFLLVVLGEKMALDWYTKRTGKWTCQ